MAWSLTHRVFGRTAFCSKKLLPARRSSIASAKYFCLCVRPLFPVVSRRFPSWKSSALPSALSLALSVAGLSTSTWISRLADSSLLFTVRSVGRVTRCRTTGKTGRFLGSTKKEAGSESSAEQRRPPASASTSVQAQRIASGHSPAANWV